jgi:dipeptidyl aminopeptidase/acylaminoacyl peptidase
LAFLRKAKNSNVAIFTKENFNVSPDLYVSQGDGIFLVDLPLSSINPQQKDYKWGTAELIKWKAYTGKETQGIVYKPEDFDPKKKYPLICYFYETLSDGLYTYHPPSPTPSRLNISFFVSRGYVVAGAGYSLWHGSSCKRCIQSYIEVVQVFSKARVH